MNSFSTFLKSKHSFLQMKIYNIIGKDRTSTFNVKQWQRTCLERAKYKTHTVSSKNVGQS